MIKGIVKYHFNLKGTDFKCDFNVNGFSCTLCDTVWYPSDELDKVDLELSKIFLDKKIKAARAFMIVIDSYNIDPVTIGITYKEIKELQKKCVDVKDKYWTEVYKKISEINITK